MNIPLEPFEVFAIRYGHLGNRHPGQSYILADPHEFGPDLDYFVWVVRRGDCMFVIDTGFAQKLRSAASASICAAPWTRCGSSTSIRKR